MNKRIASLFYIGLILFLMFLPIVVVCFYSFNESKISSVFSGFSLRWYHELFQDEAMFEALKNSVVLAILSSFFAAFIGTLGAIGISRRNTAKDRLIAYISTLPIMIPEIILAMIFMSFFSLLSLPFGMLTLLIAHTTFCIPYIFMMVKARLSGMDPAILEAARDLGANERQIFFDILLPLIFPAVASGMILSFAMSFDDVIISIFVTGASVNTLPIKIYTQMKTIVTPEINALCTLMLLVTILIIFLSLWINQWGDKRTKDGQDKI